MHKALETLPVLGSKVHGLIGELTHGSGENDRGAIIEEICALIMEALRGEELTESQSTFLIDHAHHVHARIKDPQLGARLLVVD